MSYLSPQCFTCSLCGHHANLGRLSKTEFPVFTQEGKKLLYPKKAEKRGKPQSMYRLKYIKILFQNGHKRGKTKCSRLLLSRRTSEKQNWRENAKIASFRATGNFNGRRSLVLLSPNAQKEWSGTFPSLEKIGSLDLKQVSNCSCKLWFYFQVPVEISGPR